MITRHETWNWPSSLVVMSGFAVITGVVINGRTLAVKIGIDIWFRNDWKNDSR